MKRLQSMHAEHSYCMQGGCGEQSRLLPLSYVFAVSLESCAPALSLVHKVTCECALHRGPLTPDLNEAAENNTRLCLEML